MVFSVRDRVRFGILLTAFLVMLSPLAATVSATTPESDDPPVATETETTQPDPTETETTEPDPTETETTEPDPTETETAEPDPTETETVEPDPTETEEPDGEGTPDPDPTATEEVSPVVTWEQPNPVRCESLDGSNGGLAINESETFRCVAEVRASSDTVMPEDMTIAWNVKVGFPYEASFALPEGSSAEVLSVVPGETSGETLYNVTNVWQNDSGVQQVEFDIVISRTVCAVGDNLLTVSAEPLIGTRSGEAEIVHNGVAPDASDIVASFLPNLDAPTLSMQPLDFGRFEFDGESWGTSMVTGEVIVSNDGCETSQDFAINIDITSDSPGMMPEVVSKSSDNENVIASSDEATSSIATVSAGFQGEAQVSVDFQLTPGEVTEPGEHTMTIWLTVEAAP